MVLTKYQMIRVDRELHEQLKKASERLTQQTGQNVPIRSVIRVILEHVEQLNKENADLTKQHTERDRKEGQTVANLVTVKAHLKQEIGDDFSYLEDWEEELNKRELEQLERISDPVEKKILELEIDKRKFEREKKRMTLEVKYSGKKHSRFGHDHEWQELLRSLRTSK